MNDERVAEAADRLKREKAKARLLDLVSDRALPEAEECIDALAADSLDAAWAAAPEAERAHFRSAIDVDLLATAMEAAGIRLLTHLNAELIAKEYNALILDTAKLRGEG